MAVFWASMVYEISAAETQVRYVVSHDADADLVFKVTVLPIGADARISSVREEHEDSVYSIFCITFATALDVEVSLTWV